LLLYAWHFFVDNLKHFVKGEATGVTLLGAYTSEQAARDVFKTAGEQIYYGAALIIDAEWYMFVGDVRENKFFVGPQKDAYEVWLGAFLYKVQPGHVAIGIFNTKEAAEDAIELIWEEQRDVDERNVQ